MRLVHLASGSRATRRDGRVSPSHRLQLLTLALLVGVVSFALAPGTAAAAIPGDHLWADTVFTIGVSEHEGATAVATDAAGFPIVVGTAVTFEPDTMEGYKDIRYYSYDLTGVPRWTAVPTTWDNPENPGFDDTACGRRRRRRARLRLRRGDDSRCGQRQ